MTDALKQLAEKVKKVEGKAHFPADEYDIQRVILVLHETVSELLAILLAEAEGEKK